MDIGQPEREIEVWPTEEPVPTEAPETWPEETPDPQPEKVPA